MDDSEFDAAWRELKNDDAATRAPARVRPAVMAAWSSSLDVAPGLASPPRSRTQWISLVATLAAAAVALVVGALTMRQLDRGVDRPETSAAVPLATAVALLNADTFQLIADPAFENESFEIVRVRVPRTSLDAMGVGVIGPEVVGLVDVDLVVGGDGLPRAIRGVRPVLGSQ